MITLMLELFNELFIEPSIVAKKVHNHGRISSITRLIKYMTNSRQKFDIFGEIVMIIIGVVGMANNVTILARTLSTSITIIYKNSLIICILMYVLHRLVE